MSASGHWIHDLDPVLIHLWGDRGVTYYGLAYVLGFVFGLAMHRMFRRRGLSPLTQDQEDTALFAMMLGVLGGARIGYVLLYALPETIREPWFILQVWKGGMSSHGGFIGVVIACWYVARKSRLTLVEFGDIVAPVVPLGFFLGRIANFINGELWGNASSVPWAVVFPRSAAGMPLDMIPARHPSQLYEALLEGAVLLAFMQWRIWRTGAQRHPGRISGEFLLLYSVFRIFCEQFREPDAELILGLSRGIFYSFFLVAGGVWLVLRSRTAVRSAVWGEYEAARAQAAPAPAPPAAPRKRGRKR